MGKGLHSRQSDELEQWQDIRDQVKELQAVLGAELQNWKNANDEAAETIRDQHVKGNKDGIAKMTSGFPSWVVMGKETYTDEFHLGLTEFGVSVIPPGEI